ncbi:hypothetical protein MHK_005588, partial [Candidatus Magnetomorum sp. HK-1]
NQTTDEDTAISSISFTVTDVETAGCSHGITFDSSDTVLIPVENISYTCSAGEYYLSITPATNQSGNSTITITVIDAGNLTTTESFILTVNSVNDTPSITSVGNQTTDEDTAISSISFTVTDVETAGCSHGITFDSSDTVLIPVENISYTCSAGEYYLSITPATNQSGNSTITITATDAGNLTATESFNLSVTNINDAPILSISISNRIATEGTDYTFTFNENTFFDADAETLSYTATQSNGDALPSWLTFDGPTRTFSGLPANSDVGLITITITATDSSAQSVTDTFELNVTNTNSAPVLDNPVTDQTISEDVAYSFTFLSNTFSDDDIAFGDTLSYSATLADGSPLPSWLTFDGILKNFSGTPLNADVGMITITLIATDTLNLTAMDSFSLTVVNINDAPEITTINNQTIDEDTIAGPISFTITDIESTSLTVYVNSSNLSLIPLNNISQSCSNSSCTLTLTPAANENGSTTITVTVVDPQGLTDISLFEVMVSSVNDPPTMTGIVSQTIDEDTVLSISLSVTDIEDAPCSMDLTATSSDITLIPNENITYTCNAGLYEFTITPAANQTGSSSITIMLTDAGSLTATEIFTLTVDAVNDTPSISSIVDQTTNEDITISSIDFTVSDIETAGCDHAINIDSSDTNLVPIENISYSCSADVFYLTITPTNNQNGSSNITITATDEGGLNATEVFTLTVDAVNDSPSISSIADQTTNEDTTISSIDFTVSDIETAVCDHAISIDSSDTNLVPIENITYSCSADVFYLTITPTNNQNGSSNITITATDEGGLNATEVFTLTVDSVNDVPSISSIADQTTSEDITISSIDFTVSDIETAGCDHGINIQSSDTNVIPVV